MVIPGAGTLPPDRWSDGQGDVWLKSIKPKSAVDVGIFSFPNELTEGDSTSLWSQVEAQGAAFLSALHSFIQINEVGSAILHP